MFARATSILLLISILKISAQNWTHSDTAAFTLQLADSFQIDCLLLTHSENMSPQQIQRKTTILHSISKVTWHPVVGWTTYKKIVETAYGRRKGREECMKPIYIILEYKSLKTDLEAFSKLVQFSGAIFMLVMDSKLDADFFTNMRIHVNSELYIAAPDQKTNRVTFSEAYSVGYRNVMEIVDLGYWTKKEGLVLSAPKYFVRRANLRGQVLRTASVENWPITSFDRNLFSRGRVIDGFYARIWFDLEVMMNFTTTFPSAPPESTGMEISDGVYNGVIGMAQRHEIDVAVTEVTMTPRRSKVVDLVQPFMKTRYQVYFRLNDEVVIEWLSIFRPFHTNAWIAIMLTIIICSSALYWINHKANQLEIGEHFTLNFSDSFFLILQTFCSQGTDTVPQRNAFRICLLFSYLTAAVVLPSYSAALISALSKKTETKPYDTIEGLLKARIPLLVWPNSADYEVFSQAEDPLFHAVYQLVNTQPDMKKLVDYEDMLEYICNSTKSVAAFGVETGIQALLRKFERTGFGCRIAEFTNGVFSSYQTIAFVKNSPYSHIVNMKLLTFRERGLLKRYEKQYIPTWVKKDADPTFEVSIAEVASIFALLLSGIILSCAILIVEHCYHHSRPSSDIIVVFDYRN